MDPRLARRVPEHQRADKGAGDAAAQPDDAVVAGLAVRDDLERIRFSPYFSRLAAVTQVVSQHAAGGVVHNRLTHTLKVTAVARAIATALQHGPHRELLDRLGGCDPVVVQAAASAHDLGHPPFGHLGERTLDRLARERFGLADGFEGNAQTFRILTELDVHGPRGEGLNLTAAVRAAVLKYPWARILLPAPHPSEFVEPPRGGGPGPDGPGSLKFSAYLIDVVELEQALAAYPAIGPGRQTVECSVMDVADDIAYSLHDLDDFHRAGVLQHAAVAAEFRTWIRRRTDFAALPRIQLQATDRRPGTALEALRRRLRDRDGWIFDDDAFGVAVGRVATDLVDGLLAVPFDSSMAAERAIGTFTDSWIAHLRDSVEVRADPPVRAGHVVLNRQGWHEVAVLKVVHQRFVLDRPDLAMFQRGQAQALTSLVDNLDAWLTDPTDAARAPRRLVDLVQLATAGYQRLAVDRPELLVAPSGARPPFGTDSASTDAGGSHDVVAPSQARPPAGTDIARLGRGRGIIDYVASLTDDRAGASARTLAGLTGQLWTGSAAP